jgi:hypothetical protein
MNGATAVHISAEHASILPHTRHVIHVVKQPYCGLYAWFVAGWCLSSGRWREGGRGVAASSAGALVCPMSRFQLCESRLRITWRIACVYHYIGHGSAVFPTGSAPLYVVVFFFASQPPSLA